MLVGESLDQRYTARILADPNHGAQVDPDGDGVSFHAPTRVILDLAVSELEAQASDPPLVARVAGLPAASSSLVPNAALLLPVRARPEQGQPGHLTNLAGAGLSSSPGAPLDAEADALALAFRSGGASDVTGDMNMGLLVDNTPPNVVAELRVELYGPVPNGPVLPQVITIPRVAWTTGCTTTPKRGDRLSAPGMEAVVIDFVAQQPGGIEKMRVHLLQVSGPLPIPGPAVLTTAFDPNVDDPACFVRYSPSAGEQPSSKVSPRAKVRLRFSEPMDASSLRAFEEFQLKEVPGDASAMELVVGQVIPSADATRFEYVPSLPLNHQQGTAETFYVELGSGPDGPTDLAGNPLAAALPVVAFTLDAAAPTSLSAGLVLRFRSADELYDDGFPELHGQHLFDFAQDLLLPRPVARFPVSADVDNPIPGAMSAFPAGTQGVLNPLGAKLHSLWRYVDLGFSATDETNYNVDVEGMSWVPVGGAVISDAYDEFQISLGHSVRLPDEFINPATGFPLYPSSGLLKTYADNFLPPEPDGGTVVHPRQRGYVVNPADLFAGISGAQMMPWPLNQGVPLDEFQYYTWRDSALLETGGASGAGVPLAQEAAVLGLPPGTVGSLYDPGAVRSVALPLLMEFRCYPDMNALGLNAFSIALATNSSIRPNFRAFSAGGINTSGQTVFVDPDQQPQATGGFNPSSTPPGAMTPGLDNSYFRGQLDLVTRVSRSVSIWLPTGSPTASFAPPLVGALAGGDSSVSLAYRGATHLAGLDVMSIPPDDISTNGANLDIYGDPTPANGSGFPPGNPIFLNGDSSWHADLQDLDSSSWFQFRVTFVGDAATNETAALDSLGFAFAP